jgi:hypothetical protein
LRLGDRLVFNVLPAQTSADWKTKAEGKYKKPIFVRLLELLLIAKYSRLLFLQPQLTVRADGNSNFPPAQKPWPLAEI